MIFFALLIHYLQYTGGSMAGLGFSMAILGISVGIFLGFLLWKRHIGLLPGGLPGGYYFGGPSVGARGHSPL